VGDGFCGGTDHKWAGRRFGLRKREGCDGRGGNARTHWGARRFAGWEGYVGWGGIAVKGVVGKMVSSERCRGRGSGAGGREWGKEGRGRGGEEVEEKKDGLDYSGVGRGDV